MVSCIVGYLPKWHQFFLLDRKRKGMASDEDIIEVDRVEYIPETAAADHTDMPEDPHEFTPGDGFEPVTGYRDLFSKTGQEIPKITDDGVKPRGEEQRILVSLYSSPLSYWWCEVKDRVRSAFVKPKRDPFIASFFEPVKPKQRQSYNQH